MKPVIAMDNVGGRSHHGSFIRQDSRVSATCRSIGVGAGIFLGSGMLLENILCGQLSPCTL